MRGARILAVIAVAAAALGGCPGPAPRPATTDGAGCDRGEELVRQASGLRRDGYLDRALLLLDQAQPLCPTPAVLRARAEVLGALGLVDRAIAVYQVIGSDVSAEVAALRALPPAKRDASAKDRAAAAALYQEGTTLRFAGNFAAALDRLRRSYALYPHPLTIVQIGQVHKAAGREVDYRIANARALALAEESTGRRAELRIHQGHTFPVKALALSPDGRTLASGSSDLRARLWDLSSGRPLRELAGYGDVNAVAFSRDGTALFLGRTDAVERVDVVTGERAWLVSHWHLETMAASATHVASGDDKGVVKLWDAISGTALREHKHSDLVYSLAFSPDGRRLAAGARGGEIRVWDVASGAELARWTSHDNCYALAWSPDGSLLASGNSGQVQLWNPVSGTRVDNLAHNGSIYAVAFSAAGDRLASASDDGTAMVWDLATRTPVATLRGHQNWVAAVLFRGDGQLVTGSWDNTIVVWDIASATAVRTLRGHGSSIAGLAFAPDGARLAAATDDYTVKLWDLGRATSVRSLAGHTSYVKAVAYSADGLLASAGADKTVRLWRDGAPVATLTGHDSWIHGLAFTPRGDLLVSSGGTSVYVWDVAAGHVVRVVRGHDPATYGVAISPDGKSLACGGEDYTQADLQAHDLAGDRTVDYPGPEGQILSVAFSPDGRRLAAAGHKLTIWDVAGGQPRVTMPIAEPGDAVYGLSYDHRGARLAAGSLGIIVMFGPDGSELYRLAAHDSRVRSVAFSPDDRVLASGSEDRTVKLWDAASGEQLATLFADGDRWLVFAPDGRVDASSEDTVADLVYWQVGDTLQLPAFVGWQRNQTPGLLGSLYR